MNTYLILKTIHIVSSVFLVGTGFGTAFYLFFANRSGSVESIAVVSRLVVRADWWFTTPAVIIQPVTGLLLMELGGWPPTAPWLLASFALFALAGICWLPVVWLQLRMARAAAAAKKEGGTLPQAYWADARLWERLGYPAFLAMAVVYFLMVVKPGF